VANEVVIRITARDDTAGVRDVIRNGFGVTGKQAGEEFTKGVGEGTKATAPTTGTEAGKKVGEQLGKGIGEGGKAPARKSGEDVGDEASKAAKDKAKKDGSDAGSLLGAALLAGAPLAGAAAGAALVGGVGLGLVGLAGVVAKQNTQVKQSFSEFGAELKADAQTWGDQMEKPIVQSLGVIEGGFQKLKPQITEALGNTSPDIVLLGRSVSDLATQAMPGLVSASGRLIPVFSGVDGAARSVGQATGQMVNDVSQHSTQIGTSISQVGQIVASLETTVGHLVGDMADTFAHGLGGSMLTTLNTFGTTVSGIAHTALPALGGGIQADLAVLNGFLGALGPASSLLGVFGGTAASAYMNVSLLGKLDKPIGSAATALENAGTKGTVFGDTTTKIAGGLTKVGNSLPYIGVGLALIGTAMDLDAQHAQDLADQSDKMAASLEQGGTRAAQTRKQMDDMRKANDDYITSMRDLQTAQKDSVNTTDVYGDKAGKNASQIADLSQKVQDNRKVVDDTLKKYNDWAASMGLTAVTADQLSGKVAIYSNSTQAASSNTSQLKADIDVMNAAASTADQKIKALADSLAILGDNGFQKAQDYAAQFGTAIDGFTTQMQNAKGAVFDTNHELNTTTERGRDVLQVLEQSQQSWAGQAQAMADAGATTDDINRSLQNNQNQLVGVLSKAGLTKDQIQGLIDKYHLVPSNISTQVSASTAQAQGVIDRFITMNNGRTIQIYTSVLGSGGIASAGRLAHGGVMGGAASGKVLGSSGLTVVGEQGAELIRNVAGATVVPRSGVDKAITDALGNAGGRGGGSVVLEVVNPGDEASQFVAMMIRRYVRVHGGGDVQTALGRNS